MLGCCGGGLCRVAGRSGRAAVGAGRSASAKAGVSGTVLPGKREEKAFVDLDTERLCSEAAMDYLKDSQPIKLRPRSEYPDWLWSLTQKRRELHEMDPERDGWEYWREYLRLASLHRRDHNALRFKSTAVADNRRRQINEPPERLDTDM